MGSKRSKKSKQELEMFAEKMNNENGEILEPQISDTTAEQNNGAILPVAPKATKRKKKNNGEEVPKKIKRTSENQNGVKKVRVRKTKPKNVPLNNGITDGQLMMTNEIKNEVNGDIPNTILSEKLDKRKNAITWPNQDVAELINRIEVNIPEADSLAYRSRVEKLHWDNVAFKNYTAEDCKKTWLQVQKRIRRYRLLKELLNDAKEWVTAPKPSKTNNKLNHKLPRPKKHPDMPRRPLSSYLLFYLTKKDEIISENPGLDGSDITKIVGQIYKNLTPETREQYEKQAASNREEYMEKLKIFFEKHPEYVPPARLKLHNKEGEKEKPIKDEKEKLPPPVEKLPAKVEKEPTKSEKEKKPKPDKEKVLSTEKIKPPRAVKSKPKSDRRPGRPPKSDRIERPPKKCQTPFGLYFASELKNMEPGMEKSAFREKCKLQYKQMPDKNKVHWINLAELDLIRYQEDVKAYKAKYPSFKAVKVRSILTKREKASKERASGKPVKPPNSAYALYSKVMLQSDEIKSIHPKDRMNYIACKWKTVSEEEQNSYRDKVVTSMEQYRQEYQAYVESLPEDEKRKIINAAKRKKSRSGRSSGRIRRPKKRKSAPKVQTPKEPTIKFTEPEQPPISACKYFATLFTGEGDAVQAWKALPVEEKQKYEEELVKKKQAYIVEFEKFLKSLSKEELEAFSKSRQQQVQSDEEGDESSECSSGSEGDDEDEGEENNEDGAEAHSENEPHESDNE